MGMADAGGSKSTTQICWEVFSSELTPEQISTVLNIISFNWSTMCHKYSVHSLGTNLTQSSVFAEQTLRYQVLEQKFLFVNLTFRYLAAKKNGGKTKANRMYRNMLNSAFITAMCMLLNVWLGELRLLLLKKIYHTLTREIFSSALHKENPSNSN